MSDAMPVLIPRTLTYGIRQALDVALAFDVVAVEAHADYQAMRTLDRYRAGQLTIPPEHWVLIRAQAQHLWRCLVRAKRAVRATVPEAHPIPDYSRGMTVALEQQAHAEHNRYMATRRHQRCYRA